MAFPSQQQDPNSLVIALGVKKPNANPRPQSLRDRLGNSSSTSSAPMSSGSSSPSPTDPAQQQQQGQKVPREQAGFIPAGQVCGGCSMFTKETGDCSAVEGVMQPHDSCANYYQAANQGQQQQGLEPDSDDQAQGQQPGAGAVRV